MHVEHKMKWAGLLLMALAAWGCSTQGMSGNAFDLAGIRKNIEKPPIQEGAVESSQDISQAEEAAKVQPVKDLATMAEGGNPYLKQLPNRIATPAEEKLLSGEGVLLNFDNADIYEVVQVIAEILDLSFIIDPQVKGVVNIRSGRKIPMSQLYAVFKKLLNINGLDIRSEGNYNYVYKVGQPGAQEVFGPDRAGSHVDSPRMVIQIIPVMHLPAAEAKKLLEPYKSEQGKIDVLDNPNTLFISDYESKVVDMLMILAKVDISPMASFKIRMVRVNRAPLFDLRDELKEILTALKVNKQGYEGISIMALERVNSLLLLSSDQELLESATRWVEELDVIPSEGRDNIYIYNVRNSVASELAALVNDLISDQPGTAARSQPVAASATSATGTGAKTADPAAQRQAAVTPVSPPAPAVKKTGKAVAEGAEGAGPGLRFAGQPVLIPDDSRNVILLRALPPDYTRLLKLLERLDNMPRQVLIEVMVAEVALSDSWEMGIEWALHKKGGRIDGRNYDSYLTSNSQIANATSSGEPILHNSLLATGTGLTYSVLNSAGDLAGVLNAIADNNDLQILSSPQVMVLNNETATVNVGEQVPIVTTQSGNISNTDSLNQTIEYKDTGVILKVTPKINYDGIIILTIDQQVSSAATNSLGGTTSPKISNRQLVTKLAVRDGQTVFMGGLIENKTNYVDSGVPLLKDIPLLGWLFKYQREKKDKTELLVMITPYVIESEDVLGQYVQSFNEKMDGFRKRLNGNGKKTDAPAAD